MVTTNMELRSVHEGQESQYSTDEQRWSAVGRRDCHADGKFYFAVRTTGIYCRPSCPARHPKRENVVFYATAEAAGKAGYRGCKRCVPNEVSVAERNAAAVAKACRLIETSEEMPKLGTLANAVGISRFHFHRLFKSLTGVTPKTFAAACRGQRIRDTLPSGATVTDAIYGAGFNSNGAFYAKSNELLGMRPGRFRDGGTGEVIRFAVGEASLGSILVAATESGVCAILLGDDPDALVRDLQDRFPNARLVGADADFEEWVSKAVGLIESPRRGLDLPLDLRGTAFQKRVWHALSEIPPGSTASYSEIARRVGAPGAVRAVAQACAANPVAVAIPCHRVVRRDGALSGYRWGAQRKRKLLERETA
jgi:AraC family transcriptional regulator, regulatory protein of adaptative response / methylated-DNA-[protein]-cysteine methyltransferase